ncbi:heavy metal-associated isoprenylated plant protein 7-like [Coffea eugenioides]|uniref:heavy metal-associated isoprenylated plant protein 7-like n=1 Tax=Coffea eugenioides TaxID=49369 RepID=UPI000F60B405|nr:heavy metal-associated isoprenylated plant protein 7-like [Coffea eugenioides]
MGEEKKEEANKEEQKKQVPGNKEDTSKKEEEGDKKEEKKEEEVQEIVLKVDMHCEACARKVTRALKGFQGVESVTADCKGSKVVVKGKSADPVKVCERIHRKSGRKVELISPLPKPLEEAPTAPVEEKKTEEPPAVITVVLNVQMHCEACAQVLQKRIRKVQGVESVTTDVANNQVVVKGVVDPEKLVTDVYKRTRKQASIVKDEAKKEDEKKDDVKTGVKENEKKESEEGKEGDDVKTDAKKSEYWPQRYYYMEYAYPSLMFSDENPHACTVM